MRSFFATLAGIAAAAGVVFLMESLGHVLFAPIGTLDPQNPESIAQYVARQPLPAKLWLVLSWSIGTTSGCFIATRIVKAEPLPAVLVGVFMALGIGSNAYAIPHPMWLIGLGLVAVLMGALTGYRLGLGKPSPPGANQT